MISEMRYAKKKKDGGRVKKGERWEKGAEENTGESKRLDRERNREEIGARCPGGMREWRNARNRGEIEATWRNYRSCE